jgi:AcrR family transcriptional regulator
MSIKSAKARERILHAATELFATQGIRATGIDSIVNSATVSKMSLYKYFPSKEALIVAYLQNRDAELWTRFIAQVDGTTHASKDPLLAIFDVLGEWLTDADFQGCPFITSSAEFPDQSHEVHRVSSAFYRKLQDHMTDLAEQVGARSPHRLAAVLLIANSIE